MSDIRLTHAQLTEALANFARMLAAEGTQAQLYIVGGANPAIPIQGCHSGYRRSVLSSGCSS